MKNLICLAVLFGIISCSTSTQIVVNNVQDLNTLSGNSFIYSLPRTRLAVTLKAVRHNTIPGPYSKYAAKFLSIESTPSVSQTYWELLEVTMDALNEPDPEYYFAVQADNPEYIISALLEMKEQGLVLKLDETNEFIHFQPDLGEKPEALYYTDLSIKRNFKSDSDKSKSKQGTTEVRTDLPISKQKTGLKSDEQKAEEAANFIIKIRKRRFKLLAGQYEVTPQGTALETSVKELNKLEQEYLALFIGKTYSDTIEQTYYYTPKPGSGLERFEICRFSNETGFADAESVAGKPLVLELKDIQITAALDHLRLSAISAKNANTIFYRVPDKAVIKIYFGSLPVIDSELKIFQYGTLVPYGLSKMKK